MLDSVCRSCPRADPLGFIRHRGARRRRTSQEALERGKMVPGFGAHSVLELRGSQAAPARSVLIVASLVPANGSLRQSAPVRLPGSRVDVESVVKCSRDCPALVA